MDTQALVDLERAGWKALCDGTGGDFYGELMSDDALMVLANGQVMTRDEVVEALSQAPAWSSYDIDDLRMVAVGYDVAALVYTGTGRREGAPPFVGVMTSVYVNDGESWRLKLYQQTALDQS